MKTSCPGLLSSSKIVMSALVSSSVAPPVGVLNATVTTRLLCTSALSMIGTTNVWLVTPGGKVSVPLAVM